MSAEACTTARETDVRRLLTRARLLRFDAATDFESASRVYRRCHSSGVTPRGMLGCMIAAVARRRGATLLSHDLDLHRVAQVVGIGLDRASLRAT